MARAADGEWRALDGEAILRTYRLAAGYLYEAQLRHELTRRLGARVDGAGQGDGRARARPGGGDPRLLDPAAVARRAHGGARHGGLRRRPRRGARDPGGEGAGRPAAAARASGRRARPSTASDAASSSGSSTTPRLDARVDRAELAERCSAADGLTAKQTTFTMPELVCAVAGSLRDGAPVEQRARRGGGAVAASRARAASSRARRPGGRRGSRPASCSRSSAARSSSRSPGSNVDAPRPDRTTLARALLRVGTRALTSEQRHARPRGLDCRPTASSASSAPPAPARRPRSASLADAYRESERRRCSVRRRAAAPPTSCTPRPASRAARCTGCCSTRTATAACRTAACWSSTRPGWPRRGCSRRCSSSSSGRRARRSWSATRTSCRRSAPAASSPPSANDSARSTCSDNRRQRDPSERSALAQLRDGDPEAYLAHAARHGRLHLDDDPTAAKQRLLEDWWQTAQHDLAGSGDARLPPRRRPGPQRRRARRCCIRAGRLGPDALDARRTRVPRRRPRPLPPQRRSLGVRNGTRATVVDARRSTTLTLRTRRRRAPPVAARLRGRAPRARLRAHRPRRSGRDRRARLRPRSPTRARSRSGATSPARAPAPKRTSTSPSATHSSETRHSASRTRSLSRTEPPARSCARPPSHSRSTSATTPAHAFRPRSEGALEQERTRGRSTRQRRARARATALVESRQPARSARGRDRVLPGRAPRLRKEAGRACADVSVDSVHPPAEPRSGRGGADSAAATGADDAGTAT